jgi:hypothetical protein
MSLRGLTGLRLSMSQQQWSGAGRLGQAAGAEDGRVRKLSPATVGRGTGAGAGNPSGSQGWRGHRPGLRAHGVEMVSASQMQKVRAS